MADALRMCSSPISIPASGHGRGRGAASVPLDTTPARVGEAKPLATLYYLRVSVAQRVPALYDPRGGCYQGPSTSRPVPIKKEPRINRYVYSHT